MKNLARFLILALVIVVGSTSARATLYQVIFVNIITPQVIEVEWKRYDRAELAKAVASYVKGDDRIMIKLLLPGSISKTEEKRIIDECRKVGAKSFFVAYKA